MNSYDWTITFKSIYDQAVRRYQAGHRDPDTLCTPEEQRELEAIGAIPMELFDYAEDAQALDWETALLIVAARRDYYVVVQNRKASDTRLQMVDFPAKDAELHGIPWLPRLILKAKCRLRGELPKDMMYCCGGDRAFFKKHDIHPADFLRYVWSARGDETKILNYVRGQR